MEVLDGVAFQNPQTAYDGLQKYLQQEWYFVQRVIPNTREALQPMEEALENSFLPALFQRAMDEVPKRGIICL